MKRNALLPALCLLLTILSGCGSEPQSTLPVQTQPAQVQPEETTEPPTEPEPGSDLFRMELPVGFVLTDARDDRWVYSSPNAPEDPSTIVVELVAGDEEILTMSTEQYKKQLEVSATADEAVQRFRFIDLWKEKLDGFSTIVCEYNLVYSDYITHTFRYEVLGDKGNLVFTFTDATDGNEWLDLYMDSVSTILVVRSDGMGVDFSDLTLYRLDCGLRLYAQSSLVEHDAAGFTACLGNRNAIILFMADHKEANQLTGMDLEDYALLLRSTNQLDPFQTDALGNLYTTFYTTTEDGTSYFNMLFVKDIGEDFWVCQMACRAEDQEKYTPQFSLWASSITG